MALLTVMTAFALAVAVSMFDAVCVASKPLVAVTRALPTPFG